MKTAKVIGNIWATRKDENLNGLKLLVIQPINLIDLHPVGEPIIAADIIGAGVGETVIYVGGSSARPAAGGSNIPVDATIAVSYTHLDVYKRQRQRQEPAWKLL